MTNRAHFCRITVDRQAMALPSITEGYRPVADSGGSVCRFAGQRYPVGIADDRWSASC
jgi:hypothetical protein